MEEDGSEGHVDNISPMAYGINSSGMSDVLMSSASSFGEKEPSLSTIDCVVHAMVREVSSTL